ncbi:hypothetical protein ACFLU6_00255 [Acidobacteriota bacterium]
MGAFIGGSAYAMARDIAEGLILITPMMLRKLNKGELKTLSFELDKLLRDIRSEQPPLTDTLAIQKRSRKISRLNQATMQIRNLMTQRR